MHASDRNYLGLPWQDGGRTFAGVDCVGLAWLWLRENKFVTGSAPKSDRSKSAATVLQGSCRKAAPEAWERGDVVFFADKTGRLAHVAIYLGSRRLLHILTGCTSRVDTGTELLRRLGLKPAGAVSPENVPALAEALADPALGDANTIVLLVVALALSAASALLAPSLSGFKSRYGAYGDAALLTQRNTEIPLPDVLGEMVVAGNNVYQELPDKGAAVSDPQKWNQVIVLASGPVSLIDSNTGIRIKGVDYSDTGFFNGTNDGMALNPDQDKDNAVTGTISPDSNVPSLTLYDGAHGITVPVDIRASYDRTFPVSGFPGCAYIVFRFMDSTKFSNFNLTCRIQGRKCRTFDADGFVTATASAESLADADGSKVRFKLAQTDIVSVASVTVNGTSYSEISASAQTGNVYQLNRTKGFLEFITAPAAAATILITYDYYVRAWSDNPAMHIIYLLTESLRGRGFDENRIDWASAVDARDYYDESITWHTSNGAVTGVRFKTDYAVDDRKPIQEHLQALLDGCNSILFLSAGKLFLKPKKDEATVFAFDDTNIVVDADGSSTFVVEYEDRATKANRIRVFYHSEDTLNAETEAKADDEDNQIAREARIGNDGVVEKNLKLPAVTNQSQAERLADIFVRDQTGGNRILKWKTNIKGIPLQPGDLVTVDVAVLTSPVTVRIESFEFDEEDRMEISGREFVAAAVSI